MVTAHEVTRMISRDGTPTSLGQAIAHFGRIFKTIHILRLAAPTTNRRSPTSPTTMFTCPCPGPTTAAPSRSATGYVNEMTIDQAQLLFGRGIRGVLEGDLVPATFIPRLIDECRAGRFPIDALVQTFAFQDINQGIAALAQSSVVKPIVVFGN